VLAGVSGPPAAPPLNGIVRPRRYMASIRLNLRLQPEIADRILLLKRRHRLSSDTQNFQGHRYHSRELVHVRNSEPRVLSAFGLH